jgi:acetyltransferase-like isoleucine patch superfamily enzyme
VTIGDASWIGVGSAIKQGVRIGKKVMVGAGAVVTRSVPPHAIVMGNPARITGYVNTDKLELKPKKCIAAESPSNLILIAKEVLIS